MNIIKKGFYILLPLILGGIVGFLTSGSMDYEDLVKPFLAPPSILFPIAWSIIYLLMGISYFLIKDKYKELNIIYYLQLGVNLLWPVIFFTLKLRLLASFWIILLDLLILLMLFVFKRDNKWSFYLNIPYICWCLFATYLTIGIYILN